MDAAGPLPMEMREALKEVARRSIAHGLETGREMDVRSDEYPPLLREARATFVTLLKDGDFQGCIGTLRAHRPLVVDVAHNAHAAAFLDPRGGDLQDSDLLLLEISISVLTPPQVLDVRNEAELIARLRPGIDGLTLRDHGQTGTLLPTVWEDLPDPAEFIAHVRLKAGLPPGHWSPTLVAEVYQAEVF